MSRSNKREGSIECSFLYYVIKTTQCILANVLVYFYILCVVVVIAVVVDMLMQFSLAPWLNIMHYVLILARDQVSISQSRPPNAFHYIRQGSRNPLCYLSYPVDDNYTRC